MLVELDWEAINEDLSKELREMGRQYPDDKLYHLVLFGPAGVGKKTFIKNLKLKLSKIPTKIDGINLSLLKLGKELIHIWTIDVDEVDLNILKGRTNEIIGVLAMFDVTNLESYNATQEAIGEFINVYGKVYPVFLIGNKVDMETREITKEDVLVDAYELGNCSTHRIPYAEISNSSSFGLDQIISNLIAMSNCTQTSKCSQFPAAMRQWCNIPQYHSYHNEARQRLQVI